VIYSNYKFLLQSQYGKCHNQINKKIEKRHTQRWVIEPTIDSGKFNLLYKDGKTMNLPYENEFISFLIYSQCNH